MNRLLQKYKVLPKIKQCIDSEIGFTVNIAECNTTLQHFNIKTYDKYNNHYFNEFSKFLPLQSYPNKNIIKIHDKFEDDKNLYVLYPYYGKGTLYNLLLKMYFNNNLSEETMKPLFSSIVDIVQLCHDRNIAILNLSPENLLVDNNNNLVLSNLFNSIYHDTYYYKEMEYYSKHQLDLEYSAPELLNNKYSKASDIFSLGILFYIMLTKQNLIDESGKNILYNITKNESMLDIEHISPEAKELLFSLCSSNVYDRPTIYEIKKSDWFQL
tara:strand:- start:330 stop:1136 length:807 start_codon:yes stop_codon:yes gene_type:complete